MAKYNEQIQALGINSSKIRQCYVNWAKSKDINYNILAVYYELYINDTCTQKQICEEWLLAKQTVHSVCFELISKGDIYLENHEDNKKYKYLKLSEQGYNIAKPLIEEIRSIEFHTFDLMGEEASMWFAKSSKLFLDIFQEQLNDK